MSNDIYVKRQVLWPWRDFLTSEERDQIAGLEERAADLDGERRRITAILNPIRNRAIHRAKYAAPTPPEPKHSHGDDKPEGQT